MKLREFFGTPSGKTVSEAEWARRLGITRGYLCQLKDGSRIPSLPVALRIHDATEGQVTPFDWGE